MNTAAEAIRLGPACGDPVSGLADDGAVLQMCLEMVMAVALRNRDRLLPIWPHVHEFLTAILVPSQVKLPLCTVSVSPTEPGHCLVTGLRSCRPGFDTDNAPMRDKALQEQFWGFV